MISISGYSQSIGRDHFYLSLVNYKEETNDGLIQIELDVRMSDFISYVEVVDSIKKESTILPSVEDDYFLTEDGKIVFRKSIGSLKSIIKRKERVIRKLIIYSKTGLPVYTTRLILDRKRLIKNQWINFR